MRAKQSSRERRTGVSRVVVRTLVVHAEDVHGLFVSKQRREGRRFLAGH
uniref:Uncharacterized protein n=1 Tax=Zea mays TaxID=4577 RepID=B6U5N2_MAIZE|nr:hypothetical protein [Zea mays]